ncbi:MAG: AgmX/PglI C-terminal domain-containing protein [Pseudomonadota bacterium]
MTTTAMLLNDFVLPWEATRKEDVRFRKILKRLLLLFMLLAIVFPWLPLPEIEREQAEIVPPALAKIILQQKLPAPPPAPKPEPVEIEKPVEPSKAVKKEAPPAKQIKKAPARKKVASMGVAAFSNQLQSLRSSLDVAKLQARNTNVTTGAAAKIRRSVLGRETAVKTSGGINSSAISSHGSSTQLAGRSGVSVASPLGAGDGTGGGGTGDGSGGARGSGGGKHHSSVAGGRDMESIRRVFEQHKGAIYAIYNRALRKDPEVRGKYVFHIVIEPNGAISSIELISSELESIKLEQKLLTRIRVIDFGPDDVLATPVNYKFDFLPG